MNIFQELRKNINNTKQSFQFQFKREGPKDQTISHFEYDLSRNSSRSTSIYDFNVRQHYLHLKEEAKRKKQLQAPVEKNFESSELKRSCNLIKTSYLLKSTQYLNKKNMTDERTLTSKPSKKSFLPLEIFKTEKIDNHNGQFKTNKKILLSSNHSRSRFLEMEIKHIGKQVD